MKTNLKNVIIVRQANSNICLPPFISHDNVKTTIIMDELVPKTNNRLFKLLLTITTNFLILIDVETANKFPELVSKQYTTVILPHEGNLTADISVYNQFNETLCINCGAWFWYSDCEYKDPNNRKLMNTINVEEHLFNETIYKTLNHPHDIDEYIDTERISSLNQQIQL